MTTFYISGHLDLTQEEFDEHYVPLINSALENFPASFVVGDAKGADQMAQKYLALTSVDVPEVRVFHMFENPRHCEASRFECIGGFETDEQRDAAMTESSNVDIAWVRPGREKSGTAKNLERRKQQNKRLFVSKVKQLFDIEEEIHTAFGYKEDWVKIPLDNQIDCYWMLFQKDGERGGKVVWSSETFTEESIKTGDKIYSGPIYTQRFLPKFVYRREDLTMISVDTQTDGNKFLMIFDNEKECVDEKLRELYRECW